MNSAHIRIGVGCDHAGFRTKELIRQHLEALGYPVSDFGVNSEETVDYPIYVRPVAEAVASGHCTFGIICGGSGNGEAMVANKIRGIRCAVCWSTESARLAKEHNNANMIAIGQRLISDDIALAIVDTWLAADFEGGRHERRINQIEP